VLHHSAQNTRYTGFCSSPSENVDPSARAKVKSGAAGPSIWGGGSEAAGVVEVDVPSPPPAVSVVEDDSSVVVVESVATAEVVALSGVPLSTEQAAKANTMAAAKALR
jgi:hypothetical protein